MGKRINRRGADARVAEDPAEGFYVFGMAVLCKDLLKKMTRRSWQASAIKVC